MLDYSSRNKASPDPLTDMLRGLRLDGVDYARYQMAAPWGLLFPGQQAARFHFVAEGGGWLRTPSNEWGRLEQGDAVLLPRGAEHALASARNACAAPLGCCQFQRVCGDIAEAHGGGDGEETLFFSGSMTFNVDSQHPLLSMMPEVMWVHELAANEPGLPPLLSMMACELSMDRVGAGGILTRLADVVAAGIIRSWIERGCGDSGGWVAAARDPDIGRVLAAIHLEPGRHWTVAALASVMHASRSAFAERFASVVGETPARYVARVRMHQARQWLVRDRTRIAVVAHRLGYESEASFSRAFKRVMGVAPSHFRSNRSDEARSVIAPPQQFTSAISTDTAPSSGEAEGRRPEGSIP
jgi:AraC-like DNA-binding protein